MMERKCFHPELKGFYQPTNQNWITVPRKRDEETGLYKKVYSEEDILETLRETRLSTSEVANALGCHRTTAHQLLTELEQDGLVTSTQAGNTLIWEIADDSSE